MSNVSILAAEAIDRAKNLQEFLVFRDMSEIVFDGTSLPYSMSHTMGGPVELLVPAISQTEAEARVDAWLKGQRA
jgi:hypothetical protein